MSETEGTYEIEAEDQPVEGDDTDLTAEDANAVPSADEPDDLDGTAEAHFDGLEVEE